MKGKPGLKKSDTDYQLSFNKDEKKEDFKQIQVFIVGTGG